MKNLKVKHQRIKKLTDVQIKRLEEFNRIREELLEQGYKENCLSVSTLKANV